MDEYSDLGRELRQHGSPAFPAACYAGDLIQSPVRLHWHEELEAGFVTEGTVLLVAGRERLQLSAGEGYLIPGGVPHAFQPGQEPRSGQRSLVFDPSIVGGRVDSIFWQTCVQPLLAASQSAFRLDGAETELICAAWAACDRGTGEGALETRYALSKLLYRLSAELPEPEPAHARRSRRERERIHRMLRYLQENFDREITVSQVAASASVSTSEALRCFHSTIGMTPVQYLRSYRVQRAAELLRTTDASVADIAMACGFQDLSYFARSFRSYMGKTPLDYRKNV